MLSTQLKYSASAQHSVSGKGSGSNGVRLADNRELSNPVQRKSNHTGLPDNLKSGIENLSGHSMDDVKVHYNSSQPAQLNAHAYAQGNQIHVAPGQEKHVAHEAWHVVQQKQGRVRPTTQLKGKVNVNDDSGLEREADVMGAKAMSVQRVRMTTERAVPVTNSPVQFALRDIVPGAVKGAGALGGLLSAPGRALFGASQIGRNDGLLTKGAKYAGMFAGGLLAGIGGLIGGIAGGIGGAIAGGVGGYGREGDARERRPLVRPFPRQLTEGEAIDRMARATDRQRARMIRGDAGNRRGQDHAGIDYSNRMKRNGNRVPVQTPFGTAHIGRGPFNAQPFIGLEPDEWQEPIIRTNYDVLSGHVARGGGAMLQEMQQHMEGTGAVVPTALALDDRTLQAGTAMTALLTSGETHGTRNPVGGKPERASVRYARARGLAATYNRRDGAYVPAWAADAGADAGGTGAFREMREGRRRIPQATLDMLGYMSDSSDDEA